MQKVLVLGTQGMLGHIMAEYLDQLRRYELFGIARSDGRYVSQVMNVLDFSALEHYLSRLKPTVVINCVGVLVAKSGSDLPTAILINSYLPNLLSKLGEKLDFKLVHVSTDCVFSGKQGQYSESSLRDGDDNYARTKALGEINNARDLTVRTSIIGPELKADGTGLLDWFLKQQGLVNGYSRAYWSGVTTLELAKAVGELIEQNVAGLLNFCPAQKISKYDLLKKIASVWGRHNKIATNEDYAVDKSLVSLRGDFNYPRPDYDQMLLELKQWMDVREQYYRHYYWHHTT
jgi:dTDP-4-dehydrorhamnose reductase